MKLKWAEERITHSVGIQAPHEQTCPRPRVYVCVQKRQKITCASAVWLWQKEIAVFEYVITIN